MEYKYIALGSKATSFYDASTGLYIADKSIKKVHPGYLKGKRVTQAVQGGHLVYKTPEEYEAQNGKTKQAEKLAKGAVEVPKKDDSKYAEMNEDQKKFMMAYDAGSTPKQIAEMFNKDQLIALADDSNIEVEDKDTKVDIVNAIIGIIEEDEE